MGKCITLVKGDLVCNIPEGMTNEEIIQALFPNIKLVEKVGTTRKYVLMDKSAKALSIFSTTDRWCNSPYQINCN